MRSNNWILLIAEFQKRLNYLKCLNLILLRKKNLYSLIPITDTNKKKILNNFWQLSLLLTEVNECVTKFQYIIHWQSYFCITSHWTFTKIEKYSLKFAWSCCIWISKVSRRNIFEKKKKINSYLHSRKRNNSVVSFFRIIQIQKRIRNK